jgi:5'-nucleotidase
MRILVTNDDGIESVGLRILVEWATKLGEVTVCAPTVQQSAKSHAINIHDPIEVHKVPYMSGVTAYSVNSTPVDCVRFATLGLKTTYDLVLSGINRGFNMGEDILYSGTCGCIFEAKLRSIKAVAFSTDPSTFDHAKAHLDDAWNFIQANNLFDYADLYNVNIPLDPKGICLTRQGDAYFTDSFDKLDENHYQQNGYCIHENQYDLTIDTDATISGYVSVTPLSIKRDDSIAFETARKNLQ